MIRRQPHQHSTLDNSGASLFAILRIIVAMKALLVETMCLPPIPVVRLMMRHDIIKVEGCEHYQKRSFRNRFYVSGPQGRTLCTIPLTKGKNAQMPIKDVRIANDEPWAAVLLKLIRSNYGSAPFFDYIFDDLDRILRTPPGYLWSLNMSLLDMVFTHLGSDKNVLITEAYHTAVDDMTLDARGRFRPGRLGDIDTTPIVYEGVFSATVGFIPHLSILDMLMCSGPESLLLMK